MSRYDGLIIPRSYSEYINKTDAATLLQALQQSGVMDVAPTENSNKPARSGGIYNAIDTLKPVDTVALNNMHSVTSSAVANKFASEIKNITLEFVETTYGIRIYSATCWKIGKCIVVSALFVNQITIPAGDNFFYIKENGNLMDVSRADGLVFSLGGTGLKPIIATPNTAFSPNGQAINNGTYLLLCILSVL